MYFKFNKRYKLRNRIKTQYNKNDISRLLFAYSQQSSSGTIKSANNVMAHRWDSLFQSLLRNWRCNQSSKKPWLPPPTRLYYGEDNYLQVIIAIIPKNSTNCLLIHLNTINPHIIFTVEEKRDRQLSFLDLLITRKMIIVYPTQSTGRKRIPATTWISKATILCITKELLLSHVLIELNGYAVKTL